MLNYVCQFFQNQGSFPHAFFFSFFFYRISNTSISLSECSKGIKRILSTGKFSRELS